MVRFSPNKCCDDAFRPFDCAGCMTSTFPDEMEVTITGFPSDSFCDFAEEQPCSGVNGTYVLKQLNVGPLAPCHWRYDHPVDETCRGPIDAAIEDIGGDWHIRVDTPHGS